MPLPLFISRYSNNQSFYKLITIHKAIKHQKMNTEKNPCESDPTYSYQNCIIQKLLSGHKCKPYWLTNFDHNRICSNVSDMRKYFNTLQPLKTLADETIQERYKCLKPCTFMEYQVRRFLAWSCLKSIKC